MPQFDSSSFVSQIFWLVVCFSLLYYFMSKVYLPKIRSILQKRGEAIDNDTLLANNLRKRIDELNDMNSCLKSNSASNYKIIIEQSIKQSLLDRDKALGDLKKKIDKINLQSNQNIATFVKDQKSNCEVAIKEFVMVINNKLLYGELRQDQISIITDEIN